jgi:hypothetical protein
MEPKPEQQPPKQPAGRQPYISDEVLRPLARIIAHRLLAKQKFEAGTPGNKQANTSPESSKKSPADLTGNQEGDL